MQAREPLDVTRSATVVNADLLQLKDIGRLAVGAHADRL